MAHLSLVYGKSLTLRSSEGSLVILRDIQHKDRGVETRFLLGSISLFTMCAEAKLVHGISNTMFLS